MYAYLNDNSTWGDCLRYRVDTYLAQSDIFWDNLIVGLLSLFSLLCVYIVFISGHLLVLAPSAWTDQPVLSCKRMFAANIFPELVLTLQTAADDEVKSKTNAKSDGATGRCTCCPKPCRIVGAFFGFVFKQIVELLGFAPVAEELPELIDNILAQGIAVFERMAGRHESRHVPVTPDTEASAGIGSVPATGLYPRQPYSPDNPVGVLRVHLRAARGLKVANSFGVSGTLILPDHVAHGSASMVCALTAVRSSLGLCDPGQVRSIRGHAYQLHHCQDQH